MTDLPASTAPAASGHPLVKGRCPACNGEALFLGAGGHVTCSRLDCPNPTLADDQLHRGQHAEHPSPDLATALTRAARAAGQRDRLRHRIQCLADQWAASRPDEAAELRDTLTLEDKLADPAATQATDTETTTRVFAALHHSAEQDVTRVIGLYEQWVKAGPPPLGVPLARWWDRRLVELRNAILPPAEEPARTTAKNPATSKDTP